MSTAIDLTWAEEEAIIDYLVDPKTVSIDNLEDAKKIYQVIAKKQKNDLKQVNLRLLESDIARMRGHAVREWLPFQTLIRSVVHKYATGQLVDKK